MQKESPHAETLFAYPARKQGLRARCLLLLRLETLTQFIGRPVQHLCNLFQFVRPRRIERLWTTVRIKEENWETGFSDCNDGDLGQNIDLWDIRFGGIVDGVGLHRILR